MSHVLRVGVVDQIALFRAYNTVGSDKADLTSATAGLALTVFRIGLAEVSIASLSAKAADNTAHADGAIRKVAGNLYTVDLPDAATANQCPSIGVRGSYTGGVIEPVPHPIVNYDPAVVAVGANTTTPPTAAANATQVRTELTTELTKIADIFTDTDATIPGLIATAGSDATLAKQDEILAAVGAIEPALTGPFTRTITVTDSVSGDPIEGVSVRLSLAADTESQLTNTSGVASFTVSTGTWSYEVFRSGYAGASGTVVVSESGGTAVSLVANATTAASAPLCAVTIPIKDSYGQPIEGAAVFIKFMGFDDAAPPLGLVLSPPPPLTSDASGLVSVDLIRLANYSVTYSTTEDVRRIDVSVPDAGSYTVTE